MRIVQLSTGLAPAGAERILLELSKGLLARGHEVFVVSLQPAAIGTPIVDSLYRAGIPVHSLELRKSRPWRLGRLAPVLSSIRPDIVHAHLFHASLASRLFKPGRNYRVVNTVHVVEPRWNKRWLLLLDRWSLRWCDRETAVSRAVQTYHARMLRVPPDRVPIVYNGVDQPRPVSPEESSTLRKEWGVAGCRFVLGSVGRLVGQKGYDILLRMLPRIAEGIPEGECWGIVILGEGPEAESLKGMARDAPDRFRVVLPGFRSDAAHCMGAFDLFLMPSRFEGFGLTLAEAMGHGLPALASNVDSLPEILESYPRGEVVEFREGNESEVLRAMRRLLAMGPGTPVHDYSLGGMVREYERIYESVLA
jgi:glycosyltransferase involved in cell wall biosynthesis